MIEVLVSDLITGECGSGAIAVGMEGSSVVLTVLTTRKTTHIELDLSVGECEQLVKTITYLAKNIIQKGDC